MKLRPIGTEFFIEYPPSVWVTNPVGSRVLYKVVAHVAVDKRFAPSGMAEKVKVIGSEEIDIKEYNILLDGTQIRYIKKTEEKGE